MFEHRGVIEGFYGTPWSHADRLHLFRWMGRHGMNVYAHAPKDDPWQRASWREPYPADRMSELRAEIAAATGAGVRWVPNLSPGVPMIGTASSTPLQFSSDADLEAIVAKLGPFLEAGARGAMLSFDDVVKSFTDSEDERAYGGDERSFGRANAEFLNRLANRLGPDVTLVTVLADYAGARDTEYLLGVRQEGIDESVDVMWTGPHVVARSIEAEQASSYAGLVGRARVWIWDNYPANDFHGNGFGFPTRLYLGPYGGRAPDLDTAVSGLVSNPGCELRASLVALGTVARYLDDPASYDPEKAWRASIADLAGPDPELEDALIAFAENTRSNAFFPEESPRFRAGVAALLEAFDSGDGWGKALEAWREELGREGRAPRVLQSKLDPALAAELRPWLERMDVNVAAAEAATALLEALRGAEPMRAMVAFAALQHAWRRTLADPHTMHGDRLAHDFTSVHVNENAVDAFVSEAATRAGRRLATAKPLP